MNIQEVRKSPPKHMNSYNPESSSSKKKKFLYGSLPKDFEDQSSLDRDQHPPFHQVGSNPSIRVNYLTVHEAADSKVNITQKRAVKDDQNMKSIESGAGAEIKDYFDNKISMRRSIDKKLHYDHIKNPAPVAQGLNVKR